MSWLQGHIYKKLTYKKLNKKDFYFYSWLAHRCQDKQKYEIAVERIVKFTYSRADVFIRNNMLLGFSDIVVLNDVVLLLTTDYDAWYGDIGMGLRTLTEETGLRIHLIEDHWSTKHDMKEQYILNRVG